MARSGVENGEKVESSLSTLDDDDGSGDYDIASTIILSKQTLN